MSKQIGSERDLLHNAAVILDTGHIVSPGPADGQVPTLFEQWQCLAIYASCIARACWPDEIGTMGGPRQ